jgi:hypothetical protein
MSMDCCKCGIFDKIFTVNHAQIYACLFRQDIYSAQDRTRVLRVLGARDNNDTMETRMPKDLRGWLIHSQMWPIYVGENYLIDHAKSLCRSIYLLNN